MVEHFTVEDLPGLLALSREAGWKHTEADWATLFRVASVFGHRDDHGQVVSSCALTSYGVSLAALGMLLVKKPLRRLGLGSELMRHAISHNDARPLVLCAATEAEDWYRRFGFRTVEHLLKLKAPAGLQVPGSGFDDRMDACPIEENMLVRILDLDRQVMEANRGALFRARWEQAAASVALFKQGTETLLGYGLAVRQEGQWLLGPLVGFNRQVAVEGVRNLMSAAGEPVRIDVFEHRRDFAEELRKAGFEQEDRQPVMFLGPGNLPGRRDHLFAPAAQAYG